MKKKINFKKIILIILGATLLLFVCYVLVFIIGRPFMGEVTQDRPIMKKLCTMQAACQVGVGPYTCSFNGKISVEAEAKLNHWNDYHGCNNSTRGYYEYGIPSRIYGVIPVEACNCGGLN